MHLNIRKLWNTAVFLVIQLLVMQDLSWAVILGDSILWRKEVKPLCCLHHHVLDHGLWDQLEWQDVKSCLDLLLDNVIIAFSLWLVLLSTGVV